MKSTMWTVLLLSFVLQVCGLTLSWPGDGGIVAGRSIQLSFGGGTAPYTITVLGFAARNADNILSVIPDLPLGSTDWIVSVNDGYVRFNVTDASGGILMSYWQIVYPNPTVVASSASVASTASLATQAYISGLSTSARWATITGSAVSQVAPTATVTAVASSKSSSNIGPIVGGVLGGIAALLAIALFTFWWIRRSYPKPGPNYNNTDDAATTTAYGGYHDNNATDKVPNTMQYDPYQQSSIVSPVPRSPISSQFQPQFASQVHPQHAPAPVSYGGLPEIQAGPH